MISQLVSLLFITSVAVARSHVFRSQVAVDALKERAADQTEEEARRTKVLIERMVKFLKATDGVDHKNRVCLKDKILHLIDKSDKNRDREDVLRSPIFSDPSDCQATAFSFLALLAKQEDFDSICNHFQDQNFFNYINYSERSYEAKKNMMKELFTGEQSGFGMVAFDVWKKTKEVKTGEGIFSHFFIIVKSGDHIKPLQSWLDNYCVEDLVSDSSTELLEQDDYHKDLQHFFELLKEHGQKEVDEDKLKSLKDLHRKLFHTELHKPLTPPFKVRLFSTNLKDINEEFTNNLYNLCDDQMLDKLRCEIKK